MTELRAGDPRRICIVGVSCVRFRVTSETKIVFLWLSLIIWFIIVLVALGRRSKCPGAHFRTRAYVAHRRELGDDLVIAEAQLFVSDLATI